MNLRTGPKTSGVLTINGGSSSIKFAIFPTGEQSTRTLHGKIDRIGLRGAILNFSDSCSGQRGSISIEAPDHKSAALFLIDWLEKHHHLQSVLAVGHRVVHGMEHTTPERVTPELLQELHRLIPFAPEHLPGEIQLIEAFQRLQPALPQVVCFDTAFHQSMPPVATLLPIPRKFASKGIKRYGFHGLSYSYLMEELARLGDPVATRGRVILAHLGNGASMAAVRDGLCIDTSMGFTPASGFPMGTRSGDLDPGLISFLLQHEHLTPSQFDQMANHESGLLGLSETSSDLRDLLAMEPSDPRAAEAIALFCYQVKKWIGSFAAALGGLDILVFSGGIGENNPVIRTCICQGLAFLGIVIDESRNAVAPGVISGETSRTMVCVIPTDEEKMIARFTCLILSS